jgi:hypothetical protein
VKNLTKLIWYQSPYNGQIWSRDRDSCSIGPPQRYNEFMKIGRGDPVSHNFTTGQVAEQIKAPNPKAPITPNLGRSDFQTSNPRRIRTIGKVVSLMETANPQIAPRANARAALAGRFSASKHAMAVALNSNAGISVPDTEPNITTHIRRPLRHLPGPCTANRGGRA